MAISHELRYNFHAVKSGEYGTFQLHGHTIRIMRRDDCVQFIYVNDEGLSTRLVTVSYADKAFDFRSFDAKIIETYVHAGLLDTIVSTMAELLYSKNNTIEYEIFVGNVSDLKNEIVKAIKQYENFLDKTDASVTIKFVKYLTRCCIVVSNNSLNLFDENNNLLAKIDRGGEYNFKFYPDRSDIFNFSDIVEFFVNAALLART